MCTSVSNRDANAMGIPNEGFDLFRFFRIRMGGTANAFLFDPANDVGGNVFDGDFPGFGGAKKTHGITVYKRHIGKVQRDVFSR